MPLNYSSLCYLALISLFSACVLYCSLSCSVESHRLAVVSQSVDCSMRMLYGFANVHSAHSTLFNLSSRIHIHSMHQPSEETITSWNLFDCSFLPFVCAVSLSLQYIYIRATGIVSSIYIPLPPLSTEISVDIDIYIHSVALGLGCVCLCTVLKDWPEQHFFHLWKNAFMNAISRYRIRSHWNDIANGRHAIPTNRTFNFQLFAIIVWNTQ